MSFSRQETSNRKLQSEFMDFVSNKSIKLKIGYRSKKVGICILNCQSAITNHLIKLKTGLPDR